MYLCAKCRLSVSFVYTAHSSNNKVSGDKKKGEEKTKRKEFRLILARGASLFDKERHTIFLLLAVFSAAVSFSYTILPLSLLCLFCIFLL